MPLTLRRLGAVGALAFSASAGAAGLLNTTQPFLTSAFCRTYACTLISQTGNTWSYRLNTGDAVLLARASGAASGRIVSLSLVVSYPNAGAISTDLRTFQDLQLAAVGRVVATSGFARCYESLNGVERLASFGVGSDFRDVFCARVLDGSVDAMLASVSATGGNAEPTAAVTTGSGTGAPKFLQWYFTRCTSARGATASLIAGQGSTCGLNVDIVPNGVEAIAAEFRYELEYVENGVKGKLTLDGVDRWSVGGSGNVQGQMFYNRLTFQLPLNVRLRAERRYTSLNVIGTVVFGNGSSKRIYEPLPIMQP